MTWIFDHHLWQLISWSFLHCLLWLFPKCFAIYSAGRYSVLPISRVIPNNFQSRAVIHHRAERAYGVSFVIANAPMCIVSAQTFCHSFCQMDHGDYGIFYKSKSRAFDCFISIIIPDIQMRSERPGQSRLESSCKPFQLEMNVCRFSISSISSHSAYVNARPAFWEYDVYKGFSKVLERNGWVSFWIRIGIIMTSRKRKAQCCLDISKWILYLIRGGCLVPLHIDIDQLHLHYQASWRRQQPEHLCIGQTLSFYKTPWNWVFRLKLLYIHFCKHSK